MTMEITLTLHLDFSDDGDVWWAESPEVPGFTASADTLAELRSAIAESLEFMREDIGESVAVTREWLADDEDEEWTRSDGEGATPRSEVRAARVRVPSAA